jgi:3-carboxy-cis,cis-muconate cycloisomerase
MLDVEVALAAAQADAGLIPQAAAHAIADAARASSFDVAEIVSAGWEVGTPVLPLIDRLRALVGSPHSEHVHHGTTTQDIVDTATVLQIRAGLMGLEERWARMGDVLARLAQRHRATPMLGRSFLQAGGTISFGRKVAGWLGSVAGDISRLHEEAAALPLQLGGPLGVLDGYGDHGVAVVTGVAERLDLTIPAVSWHSDRRPIRATAGALADVAATVRNVATDTILLAQTGIEEVSVRPGRSSSVANKQNPIDAIRANAAAQFAVAQTAALLALGPHEHERAIGAWHAEWALVPTAFHGAMAAAEAIERSIASLEVHEERMLANLTAAGYEPSPSSMDSRLIDRAVDAFGRAKR